MKTPCLLLVVCLVCCTYTQVSAGDSHLTFAQLPPDLQHLVKNPSTYQCCRKKRDTDTRYGASDDEENAAACCECEDERRTCCERTAQILGICMSIDVAWKNRELLVHVKDSGVMDLTVFG